MRDELYRHAHIEDLYHLLALRAEHAPADVLFLYREGRGIVSVFVGQFWQDVHRLRTWFERRGLSGTRIGLLGENSYLWIVSYFAVVFAGAVVVPLDKDQDLAELGKLLTRCPLSLIVCSPSHRDLVEGLQLNGVEASPLFFDQVPALLASSNPVDTQAHGLDADAVCTIIFTSGTTGEPKGVMLTQRNIATNALAAIRSLWVSGSSVLTLPLHHTFGFTVGVLSAYVEGYPIFISKSLRTFAADLKSFGPQNLVAVPLYVESLYKTIWRKARACGREDALRSAIERSNRLLRRGIDLRRELFRDVHEELGGNLQTIVCGGAHLDQRYIDGMEELGIHVLNGYGITECSPVVAVNRLGEARANSVGLPLPGCEVRIDDGEVCVRGDCVMAGYWQDEASTADALADGWFRTGDLGRLDADGYLYLTGRKKNLIILSNGENVSAEELELQIQHIQNVEEVVVRQEDGVILAEIYAQVRSGIDEAMERLNRRLPPHKRIARIRYRPTEFERTNSQKIKRTQT